MEGLINKLEQGTDPNDMEALSRAMDEYEQAISEHEKDFRDEREKTIRKLRELTVESAPPEAAKPEEDSIMIEDIEPLEEDAVPIINVGGMEPVFAVRETDEELQLEEVDEPLPEESVSIEDERPPNLVNLLKDQELYEENPALQMFEPQPQLPSQQLHGQQQGPAPIAVPAPFPAQAYQVQAPLPAPLPPLSLPPAQPPQQSQLTLSPQTESLIANSLKESAAAQAKMVEKLVDEMKTLSRKVDERSQNPPPSPPVIVHMPRPEVVQAPPSPLKPIIMELPAAAPRAEGLPRYAPADLEDEEPELQPRRRRSDFAPREMPEQPVPSRAADPDLEPFAVSEPEPEIEWDPEPVSLEPEQETPSGPVPAQSALEEPLFEQPSRAQPPSARPPRAQSPSAQPSYRPRGRRPAQQAARPPADPAVRPAPLPGTRPARPAPKPSASAAETPGPRRPAATQPKGQRQNAEPRAAQQPSAPAASAAPREEPDDLFEPVAPPAPTEPRAPLPAEPPRAKTPAAPSEEPDEEPPPTAKQVPNSEPDKPARTGEDVRQELRDYLNGVRDKLDKGAAPPSKPGDLLDYLGKLSDYLPERDKKRFRGSNERLAMESLKAQLAGKKGLRQKIAESFRPVVPHRKEPMTRSLIVDTFSYLKDLSAWHPDKAIAAAMKERIESIVAQMGSLK